MSLEFEPDFSQYAHLKVIGVGERSLEILNHLTNELANPDVPMIEFAVIGNTSTVENLTIIQLSENSFEEIEKYLGDCDLLTICIDTRDQRALQIVELISIMVGQRELCTVMIVVHGNEDREMVVVGDSMKIMINRDEKPYSSSHLQDVAKAIQCYADGILLHGLIGVDYADYRAVIIASRTSQFAHFTLNPERQIFEEFLHDIRQCLNNKTIANQKGGMATISNYLEYGLAKIEDVHELLNCFITEDTNMIFSAPVQPAVKGDLEVSVLFTY